MASPAPSLSKIKAMTKKMSVGVLDRVPWFEKEPDGSVAAATDEALLEGNVDPESLSRDQLYVRIVLILLRDRDTRRTVCCLSSSNHNVYVTYVQIR
jgi:hypothetical protein